MPQVEVGVEPRSRPALRDQTGRCPAGRGHLDVRRGGRGHLPRRQGVRRQRLEHPGEPGQRLRHRPLLLDTPDGGRVRLAQVADVRVRPTPNAIEREADSRRIDVDANVEGRDLGSVVTTSRQRSRRVGFPLGYHAELLGEYAERQAAQSRLLLLGARRGGRASSSCCGSRSATGGWRRSRSSICPSRWRAE